MVLASTDANPRTINSGVSAPNTLDLSFSKTNLGQAVVDYDPLKRIQDSRGGRHYFHAAVRIDAIGGRLVNNPSNIDVYLYWATGPSRSDIIGLAAKETRTINRQKNHAGDVIHFYFDRLENRQPGRATHLVAVIDPNNRLTKEETNRANNVAGKSIPSAGDLAALVLFAGGDIKLATTHVSGNVDQASAYQNIMDVTHDRKARRSSYKDGPTQGPGGSTDLDARMLSAMLELTKTYKFRVTEIAGGVHVSNSRHYAGLAFDIDQINGIAVSSTNPYVKGLVARAKELGATEIRKPGNSGHNGHIHLAWSRIPELN